MKNLSESLSDITFLCGYNNMNFDQVTSMLSKAYWCIGIKTDEIKKAALNSALVVGVFLDNKQIGYGRVISDKTRFAYLSDIYIHEHFRGYGFGQKLVSYILNNPELADVYQWALITSDAHKIYEKCGFKHTTRANMWMEICSQRPNR